MIQPYKFILNVFFCIVSFTSCRSQTPDTNVNIPVQESVKPYTKSFWDSLPNPLSRINDFEGLFSDNEKNSLDSTIVALEKVVSVQFCIVTLDTTATSKERFDELALHIANTWGVGEKDKNNGITICISKGYRRIRICNGYGIEKILSNVETKEIMDRSFIPYFKEGHYFQGTMNGLSALADSLRAKTGTK